jgi:hypothetical protein
MGRSKRDGEGEGKMKRSASWPMVCLVGVVAIWGAAWAEEAAWYDATEMWIVRVQSMPAGQSFAVTLEVVDTRNILVTDTIVGLATNPILLVGDADSSDISLAFDEETATAYVLYTTGGRVVVHPVADLSRQMTVTPNPLLFGAVKAGNTVKKRVRIRNAEKSPMTITAIGTPEEPFKITRRTTCEAGTALKSGKSCRIVVKFSPTGALAYQSSFDLQTDLGNVTIHLGGSGR